MPYRPRHVRPLFMMTSSNGNIFRVTGPLCGEFTGPGEFPTQRPVTQSFDVFFDLRLNRRLSKQPRGWWFETPQRRQAIIWTNAGILLIGPLWTNFSEIWIKIQTLSFKKMHLKMSSAKWRLFRLGLNWSLEQLCVIHFVSYWFI